MGALILVLGTAFNQCVPTPPTKLTWAKVVRCVDTLKEKGGSLLINPGMTSEQVEKVMGRPFAVDSSGPPGQFHTTYTYFNSGISVSFGTNGRVTSVSR